MKQLIIKNIAFWALFIFCLNSYSQDSTAVKKPNNPKSEFELHIKMNDLDSIQEIYLKNSMQKFPLSKPKINYRLQ